MQHSAAACRTGSFLYLMSLITMQFLLVVSQSSSIASSNQRVLSWIHLTTSTVHFICLNSHTSSQRIHHHHTIQASASSNSQVIHMSPSTYVAMTIQIRKVSLTSHCSRHISLSALPHYLNGELHSSDCHST
jgi:hypothetical protein